MINHATIEAINNQVIIDSYSIRKMFLAFARAHFIKGNQRMVYPDILNRFYWSPDNEPGGMRLDYTDLDDKGNMEYRTGVFLADGPVQFKQATLGSRGSQDAKSGSQNFFNLADFSLMYIAGFNNSEDCRFVGDELCHFLLSLNFYFQQCSSVIKNITLKSIGKVYPFGDGGWQRRVEFSVEGEYSVTVAPEAHTLMSVSPNVLFRDWAR